MICNRCDKEFPIHKCILVCKIPVLILWTFNVCICPECAEEMYSYVKVKK